MYLSLVFFRCIFVSENKTIPQHLSRLILTTIIILAQIPMSLGQQVWPGDINNNGIVNNIDVLYWAVAKEATGNGRVSPTGEFVGQDLPAVLWDQSFPNGLNFAFADCDGDGDVDDDDKEIIDQNYGNMRDMVTPDEFLVGDPMTDPPLTLSTENALVPSGGTLAADFSLGTASDTISNFYGIAFSIKYDPEVVANQGNSVQLDIKEDTWMNGSGDDKVIQFIKNDRDLGIVEVAIVRKNQQMRSGFGDVGTFSIVMEDIVVGLTDLNTFDIQMIDVELVDSPITATDLEFSVDSTTTTARPITNKGIKLYPNPVDGPSVTLELENQDESLQRLQLFDANGRQVAQWKFDSPANRQRIDLATWPTGIYTLKIISNKRAYIRSFYRSSP